MFFEHPRQSEQFVLPETHPNYYCNIFNKTTHCFSTIFLFYKYNCSIMFVFRYFFLKTEIYITRKYSNKDTLTDLTFFTKEIYCPRIKLPIAVKPSLTTTKAKLGSPLILESPLDFRAAGAPRTSLLPSMELAEPCTLGASLKSIWLLRIKKKREIYASVNTFFFFSSIDAYIPSRDSGFFKPSAKAITSSTSLEDESGSIHS